MSTSSVDISGRTAPARQYKQWTVDTTSIRRQSTHSRDTNTTSQFVNHKSELHTESSKSDRKQEKPETTDGHNVQPPIEFLTGRGKGKSILPHNLFSSRHAFAYDRLLLPIVRDPRTDPSVRIVMLVVVPHGASSGETGNRSIGAAELKQQLNELQRHGERQK